MVELAAQQGALLVFAEHVGIWKFPGSPWAEGGGGVQRQRLAILSHPFLLPAAVLREIASIRCALHTAWIYAAADRGAGTG